MITDWAGNEIKPGMEVAFLQTEIHYPESSWAMPGFGIQKIYDAHTEQCWILSDFLVVEGSGDDLYVTIVKQDWPHPGYSCSSITYLGRQSVWSTELPVLAIKGVSDKNPNEQL